MYGSHMQTMTHLCCSIARRYLSVFVYETNKIRQLLGNTYRISADYIDAECITREIANNNNMN